jgi:hypothetical protein
MKQSLNRIAIILSLLMASAHVHAVDGSARPRIAILDIHEHGGKQDRGKLVRDMLEVAFYRVGRFDILERNRIDIIVQEKGMGKTQCYDLDCAVRLGTVLSLDYAVIGSIGDMKTPQITVRIIDVHKGVVAYADTKQANSEHDIERTLAKVVERAMEHYSEGRFQAPRPKKSGSGVDVLHEYAPALVPGLYQLQQGNRLKGYGYMGAFTASLISFGYTWYRYRESREAYDDLGPSDSWRSYEDAYEKSERDFRRMNIALGLAAALYVVHWIDVLYSAHARDETGTLSLEICGSMGYITHSGVQSIADNQKNLQWKAMVQYRCDFFGTTQR